MSRRLAPLESIKLQEQDVEKRELEEYLQKFVKSPGYLEKTGWLRSIGENQAVDQEGRPIPWLTYPAIDFLDERVGKQMDVFEYGSGNSTFWWSARVGKLVSCEHDKEWFALFAPRIPANTTYLLRRAKGGSTAYVDEISNYSNAFDIVIIDGRDRVNCVRNGIDALRSTGVIIWDNSDREAEYQEGYEFLRQAGFRRLDFWGMGALATRRWCTSIFYRQQNCLGI